MEREGEGATDTVENRTSNRGPWLYAVLARFPPLPHYFKYMYSLCALLRWNIHRTVCALFAKEKSPGSLLDAPSVSSSGSRVLVAFCVTVLL